MKFDRSHIIVMMICVFLIIFSLLTIFMGLDPVLIIATICALIAIFLIITKMNSHIDKKRRIKDIKEDEKAMVRIAEMQKNGKRRMKSGRELTILQRKNYRYCQAGSKIVP